MTAVAAFAPGCGPLAAATLQPQQAPGATGVDSEKMNVLENDIVYYRLADAQSVKF